MATVLIIGGGIAGPVLAIHLKNKGFKPIIFEKVKDVKDVGGTLMLAPNGYKALSKVGLDKRILEGTLPARKVQHRTSEGEELSSFDLSYFPERYSQPLAGVKRAKIQQILIDAVKEHEIPIHFGKQLSEIVDDASKEHVTALFSDGTQYEGSFLVGCDGLHSTTRSFLFGKESPQYTGLTQTIGISPRPPGYIEAFYNIYGVNSFVVSYPFSSTLVGWAATQSEPESPETWRSLSEEEVENFKYTSQFTKWADPVPALLANAERIIQVGLYDRPSLSQWFKGRCVLIGDAAHPTSPHLGQGANQALVDCMILVKHLLAHKDNLANAFSAFEAERIPRTTELVSAARAQGQRRVLSGADACAQRNEELRHAYDDVEKTAIGYDNLYTENY